MLVDLWWLVLTVQEPVRKAVQRWSLDLNTDPMWLTLRSTFPAQDGNVGLMKQALAARQMRLTQRLTQTYMTLSLADIARHVGLASPQEAEQHILR